MRLAWRQRAEVAWVGASPAGPACMLSMLWQTVACCIMAACVCIRTLPQGALEAAALGNVTQAILGAWGPAINSSAAAPQLLANDLAAFMRGGGALARRRLQAGHYGIVSGLDPRALETATDKVRSE